MANSHFSNLLTMHMVNIIIKFKISSTGLPVVVLLLLTVSAL